MTISYCLYCRQLIVVKRVHKECNCERSRHGEQLNHMLQHDWQPLMVVSQLLQKPEEQFRPSGCFRARIKINQHLCDGCLKCIYDIFLGINAFSFSAICSFLDKVSALNDSKTGKDTDNLFQIDFPVSYHLNTAHFFQPWLSPILVAP